MDTFSAYDKSLRDAAAFATREFINANAVQAFNRHISSPWGGPVARKPRGTYRRRCTDWKPDPANPGREISYHYTKGWRSRKA